jgi:hypothetical protein
MTFRFRLRSPNHRLQALLIAALRKFVPLTTSSPLSVVQKGRALQCSTLEADLIRPVNYNQTRILTRAQTFIWI